jgi:hydroxyacylglutathione hydrolase
MLTIHALRALKDNFIYVLTDGTRAAAVDPGEASPVLDFIRRERLQLTHVLCTHHHWDHVDGVQSLIDASGGRLEVCGSQHDRGRIPGQTLGLSEMSPLELWDRRVDILDVPGHTLGQICYRFKEEKALFVGDTLFSAGCGRLLEGTPEQMFHSLQKIKHLPGDTRIYFGHEYTLRNLDFVLSREPRPEVRAYREKMEEKIRTEGATTPALLEDELHVNPFLRAPNVASFTEWREARNGW